MNQRGEEFDSQMLHRTIIEALNLMNWKSELSYLIYPLPNNKTVVENLDTVLSLK